MPLMVVKTTNNAIIAAAEPLRRTPSFPHCVLGSIDSWAKVVSRYLASRPTNGNAFVDQLALQGTGFGVF